MEHTNGSRTKLIINADDFGWTDGHNLAVEQAHARGILTRASLMCTGTGFREAVEMARRLPELGVGVHLTLNESLPVLPQQQLPNLTRPDGHFHDSLRVLVARILQGSIQTGEVLPEWRAQIERALVAGIAITHLDAHKHVHILPPLRSAMIILAKEYQIEYVRLPLEKFTLPAIQRGVGWLGLWLLAWIARGHFVEAGLQFADTFVGVAVSGAMTPTRLQTAIENAQGVTEIMVHPARITPAVAQLQRKYRWAAQYQFEQELNALIQTKRAKA